MKFSIKIASVLLLLLLPLWSQTITPGTVTQTNQVTAATAPATATNALTCTFGLAAANEVSLLCRKVSDSTEYINTTVKLPAVGSSFTWQVNEGPSHSITGIFSRTSTARTWQVAANGTTQSGTF